jgi:hypothetical protein
LSAIRSHLPELSRALEQRYPGVQVKAEFFERETPGDGFQSIAFLAPVATLRKHGLIPMAFTKSHGEYVDEFGTRHWVTAPDAEHGTLQSFPEESRGVERGRVATQHPENEKTRYAVARILGRLARKARET